MCPPGVKETNTRTHLPAPQRTALIADLPRMDRRHSNAFDIFSTASTQGLTCRT